MPQFSKILFVAAVAVSLGACVYEPDDYYGPPPGSVPQVPPPAAYNTAPYAPGPYAPGSYAPGSYAPGTYGSAGPYDDPCVNDPAYCSYAYYEGPIWWGGAWYNGPHRWRVRGDSREFWIHGGWHRGVRIGQGGHWRDPGRWHPG
jgi:hypothetical protein